MGMMSKSYDVLDDWLGLKKNKSSAISFHADFNPDFEKVNYAYIYDKPDVKYSKSTQLTSCFNEEFFKLCGKKHKEIRETKNYYDKRVISKEFNLNDTLKLIDTWDKLSGEKYNWVRHSGFDRNFFNRFYELEKHNLFSRFFYLGEEMLGYSVLHKEPEGYYNYLIRKTNIGLGRNTSLYVDYKTFEEIWKVEQKEFFTNWGSSKGSLLKYKSKFSPYEKIPVYFYTVRNILE